VGVPLRRNFLFTLEVRMKKTGRLATKTQPRRKRNPSLVLMREKKLALAVAPRALNKNRNGDDERPKFLPPLGIFCAVCHQVIAPGERDVIDDLHGHCFDRQPFNEDALAKLAEVAKPVSGELGEMLQQFQNEGEFATNGRARRSIGLLLHKLESINIESEPVQQAIRGIRRLASGHLPPRRLSMTGRRYPLAVGRDPLFSRWSGSICA
jgi:hypothetical protein